MEGLAMILWKYYVYPSIYHVFFRKYENDSEEEEQGGIAKLASQSNATNPRIAQDKAKA